MQSSAAHKRSKFSGTRAIMVEGEDEGRPFGTRSRVHIKSDTADHFVERGGYFGHEMLVAGMQSQCAVYRRAALDFRCVVS
jgi:hypothetical protein